VWKDHLLPLLTYKEAERLERTCKALREIVREKFTDFGSGRNVFLRDLKAVLTSFPRMRDLSLAAAFDEWDYVGREALVRWLREGDRGRYIKEVRVTSAGDFVTSALREGALPSLKSIDIELRYETARAALTEGLLGAVHELRLEVAYQHGVLMDPRLAALGLMRQLPALAKLDIRVSGADCGALQWPPFVPPSLKSFYVGVSGSRAFDRSLFLALPGILQASGAGLERLEVDISEEVVDVGWWLVSLAQTLRCCSPTLRSFCLVSPWSARFDRHAQSPVEQLRVHWANVLGGVSSCRELEMLVLPCIEVGPLFSPGTAFAPLTYLEIVDKGREHPPDVGAMGLWELMASGGLPALAKLSVHLKSPWRGTEEIKTRVAPALEAVAGTLTHLQLIK
jgi:hypothetical protein